MDNNEQAVQIVAQGSISESEYAYQQALQECKATSERLRAIFKRANEARARVIEAWFRENHPEIHCIAATKIVDSQGLAEGFSMSIEVAMDNSSLSRKEKQATWKEMERYLTMLDSDIKE